MADVDAFTDMPTTTLADLLGRESAHRARIDKILADQGFED